MNDREISPEKPSRETRVPWPRALRRDAGAFLEYVWNFSGSVRTHRVEAHVVRGTERSTGEELTALYLGDGSNEKFFFKRAFAEFTVCESHSAVEAFAARRWIERYADRVDLLVLDLELLYCAMLRGEPFLRIPHWIRQKYQVPDTWTAVQASWRKNTRKTDLRKVRKYGFESRLTVDPADFEEFYHRMHKPYLEKRFDDLVIIEPEWKFMRQCRKGELLQITREGQVLGGVLLHELGGRLAYVWVGVRDDLPRGMDQGVFSAMYYFTIRHGYENGCDEIDFLGTRPVLNDGLFRYKRKWGTFVEDSPIPRGDLLVRPLSFGRGVRAIFRDNAFITRDGHGLCGKILLDDGAVTQETIDDLRARLHTPGLTRLKIFSTHGFGDPEQAGASEADLPVELFDLSDADDPAREFGRL